MPEIVVVVPVLERPANAERVFASFCDSAPDARMLFVCSPHDRLQIQACHATDADVLVVNFKRASGDFQRKINTGLHHTSEPYLLVGADDLHFHAGWDREALKVATATGCGVVATNDLGNPSVMRGYLATHALVRRTYAMEQGTIDEPEKILCELYHHNFCDVELSETARSRGQFAFALRSRVEHLHPNWGKSEMDNTYRIGLDRRRFELDRRLLNERRSLWKAGLRKQRLGQR